MSIKYIVTGGAGFIGSNLVRELNSRGEKNILIVDTWDRGEVEESGRTYLMKMILTSLAPFPGVTGFPWSRG